MKNKKGGTFFEVILIFIILFLLYNVGWLQLAWDWIKSGWLKWGWD